MPSLRQFAGQSFGNLLVILCITHCCTLVLWYIIHGRKCRLHGSTPYLFQREVLAVPEDNNLVRLFTQLGLDETQQVLLMHARAVVDVGVHLNGRARQCQGDA